MIGCPEVLALRAPPWVLPLQAEELQPPLKPPEAPPPRTERPATTAKGAPPTHPGLLDALGRKERVAVPPVPQLLRPRLERAQELVGAERVLRELQEIGGAPLLQAQLRPLSAGVRQRGELVVTGRLGVDLPELRLREYLRDK